MNHIASQALAVIALVAATSVHSATAGIPSEIHYQGRVIVDGINFDGTGQFKFLLYQHSDSDEVTDVPLWSNASGAPADLSEPTMALSLPVVHGLYAVGLGDVALANMAALPDSLVPPVPYDQVFLRVWFSDGSGFELLTPDQPVRAVPFALHARKAETVADGSIGTLALEPGAVTSANLAPGAVNQLSNPSGSIPDALQIDAIGHAGIGTATPQAALQITGGTNVTAPRVLSTIEYELFDGTFGFAFYDVAYSGTGLLAVARSGVEVHQIEIWDVSNPELPILRNTLSDGETVNGHLYDSILVPFRVAFDPAGRLLAIASGPSYGNVRWVTIVSVGESTEPHPVFQSVLEDGTRGFDHLGNIEALAFSDSDARILAVASAFYGGDTSNALSFIDLSEPASPQLRSVLEDNVDGYDRLERVLGLTFQGSLLATASFNEDAVSLLDLGDPDSPRLLAVLQNGVETGGHTYSGLVGPNGVELLGDRLAIATLGNYGSDPPSIHLVDVSDPENPQYRTTISDGQESIGSIGSPTIALGGNDLLAVGASSSTSSYDSWGDRVLLFDISDPATPVLLEELRDGQGEFGGLDDPDVLFVESLLLIAAYRDSTLTLVSPFDSAIGASGVLVENRVGIGVAAPEAALHVKGDVRIDAASTFSVETHRVNLGIGNAVDASGGAALGKHNTVNYDGIAIGSGNIATGSSSLAFGDYSVASGPHSLAIGDFAVAAGENAMAIGEDSLASGRNSIAIGENSVASENGAVAIGMTVKALGTGAWALGNESSASGILSQAFGLAANAQGDASTAIGVGTLTTSYAETALGAFNTIPTTVYAPSTWDSRDRLLVIGNGSSDASRTDLLTLYKDGRMNHAGSISTVGDLSTLSNFKYIFPRTRKYQMPAAAFDPWRSDTAYIRGDGYIQYPFGGGTTAATWKAPVHLPDGATITKLSVYYMDNWESSGGTGSTVFISHLQSNLRRMGTGADDIASELVAATLTTGTEGFYPVDSVKHALETTSIDLPLVDNVDYQYWLEVAFHVNLASSGLRFYGATIEYTQNTVAP